MIGLIVWLCVGAFVGWLASVIMKTDAQMGAVLNIVVGIAGAALGGFIMRTLGESGANVNHVISIYSILVSLLGAVVLLAIVNLVRRMTHS